MRKLYVPISLDPNLNHKRYVQDLKALGVDLVFFSETPYRMVIREHDGSWGAFMENMKEKLALYSANGFETGVWISTLGYGGPLMGSKASDRPLTRIRSVVGKESGDALCPLDEDFVALCCHVVQEIARNGARMIMLDDELWKVVNGVPMLKKVNATEGSAPSANAVRAIAGTDNNVVTNNSSEYVIYWMSENGAFDAAQFIREYMTKSTGATLNVGLADPEDTGKKQIIVGT